MSRALESALRAVERMKGDSDVSTAELLQLLAAALRIMAGRAGEADGNDRDGRPH